MQVLVKNPFTPVLQLPGTLPSFWDPACLYMDKDFSFGKALELSSFLSLSPFMSLDPKVSFLISQADEKVTYARGVGALGSVGLYFFTRNNIQYGNEGSKQLDRYVKEYLPDQPFKDNLDFSQVITFGEESLDFDLWEKLPVGGTYILGFSEGSFDSRGVKFEAFGKLWPYGEATEFGWQFNDETIGLDGLKFFKLRKLGR